MVTVRRAGPADAGGIALVHVATWREAYATLLPPAFLQRMQVSRLTDQWRSDITRAVPPTDEAVFVARAAPLGDRRAAGSPAPARGREGRVIGFASVGSRTRRKDHGDGEIYMLYVLADYRRAGVGRALLRACADHCLARGLFSASIWVLRDNDRARRLYETLGAVQIGEATDVVGGAPAPLVGYAWEDLAGLAGRAQPAIRVGPN
jgi:ribosomal protein S18 acetylase RimI-like enzyme